MTNRRKFNMVAFLTAAALLAVLSLDPARNLHAQAKSGGLPLTGWIFGQYDIDPADPNALAWIAEASFSINGEVLRATIIDRGVDGKRGHENMGGGWSGTELWSVSLEEGSTFQLEATYNASPASAPGLFTLHETGKIVNGTGRFQNASGELTVRGPFVLPDGWTPGDPRWISEIHGSVVGVR